MRARRAGHEVEARGGVGGGRAGQGAHGNALLRETLGHRSRQPARGIRQGNPAAAER